MLWKGEQWVLGYVLGLTLFTFLVFIAHIVTGMPLSRLGFLGVCFAALVVLGVLWRARLSGHRAPPEPPVPAGASSSLVRWSLVAFGAWIALRTIIFTALLFLTPSFFDDTMDNWNLRGKLFFVDREFTLIFPWDQNAQGVSSYPPSVSLAKTWFAALAGQWSDGLANGIHILWFLALLLLVYWTLRRMLPLAWSILGALMLASLPLEFIQGTGTYADIFLSVHLLAAVAMMLHALTSHTRDHARSWLRLGAFAIALVPFTKNEGFALYFPVLLLLYAGTLLWLTKKKMLSGRDLGTMLLIAAVGIAAIALPWIGFKIAHGLSFGNAKGIDFQFRWQPGVLQAVLVNTFLEGNWNFLFPLFFGLLALQWRAVLRPPLLLLAAFFMIPYLGQMFFYLFTGLGQEALFQTGYARGLIHLMPGIVTLTVLLLHDVLRKDTRT